MTTKTNFLVSLYRALINGTPATTKHSMHFEKYMLTRKCLINPKRYDLTNIYNVTAHSDETKEEYRQHMFNSITARYGQIECIQMDHNDNYTLKIGGRIAHLIKTDDTGKRKC